MAYSHYWYYPNYIRPASDALRPFPIRVFHKLQDIWYNPVWELLQFTELIFLHEIPWLQRFAPEMLRPGFCWPHIKLGDRPLATKLPPCQPVMSRPARLIMGWFLVFLMDFSRYYAKWFGVEWFHFAPALPFGLVIKRSVNTSLNEVQSMRAMRAAGFPVPKVIAYGDHTSRPTAAVSILMTRLPGEMWRFSWGEVSPEVRETLFAELRFMLDTMRSWKNPWGERICSISGGPIRTIRAPAWEMPPCESKAELTEFLLSTASHRKYATKEEFQEVLSVARSINDIPHEIVFSHGDLAFHNILIHEGHISGFIDWESAGWLPEYWDFTTALRWDSRQLEKGAPFLALGGDRYEKELVCEKALLNLTASSLMRGF